MDPRPPGNIQNALQRLSDPKNLYLSAPQRDALTTLLHGVKERQGCMVVIGDQGSGKTTMLRTLMSLIEDEAGQFIDVNASQLERDNLLGVIAERLLGQNTFAPPSHPEWLNGAIDHHIGLNRSVIVAIDDSQELDASNLNLLRDLARLSASQNGKLLLIFVGSPYFWELLQDAQLRPLRDLVIVRSMLTPLSALETERHIAQRLGAVGIERPDIVSDAALKLVFRLTAGLPGEIDRLLHHSLLIADRRKQRLIGPSILWEARNLAQAHSAEDRERAIASIQPRRRNSAGQAFLSPISAISMVGVVLICLSTFSQEQRHQPATTWLLPFADTRPASVPIGAPDPPGSTAAQSNPPVAIRPDWPGKMPPIITPAEAASKPSSTKPPLGETASTKHGIPVIPLPGLAQIEYRVRTRDKVDALLLRHYGSNDADAMELFAMLNPLLTDPAHPPTGAWIHLPARPARD